MHILALLSDLENNRLATDDIQQRMAVLLEQIDRLGHERLPAIDQELTAAARRREWNEKSRAVWQRPINA